MLGNRELAPDNTPTVKLRSIEARGEPKVAVLIPCFNEALSIGSVIRGFRDALPDAEIYVYDNNSTDNTLAIAEEEGANVGREFRQGKGNVLRRMFSDIEADCYVMVDGDDTYDPQTSIKAIDLVLKGGMDFVNISRKTQDSAAYRNGHQFGNRALTGLVQIFFGSHINDMLSGYKALSKRFVKSFPAMSSGFETETELAVHALEMRMPLAEIEGPYKARPPGSESKLRTYRDGLRILSLISRLIRDERPLQFFGILGTLLCVAGAVLSLPIIFTYLETGLVPRLPTAILCVALVLAGGMSIFSGLILNVVTKSRQEMKRLFYLAG